MKGFYIKCKECNKKFWLDIKLDFGATEKENNVEILNCFLHSVIFNFNCPYCDEQIEAGIGFKINEAPKVLNLKKPDYFG